jgi:hypothetical protein
MNKRFTIFAALATSMLALPGYGQKIEARDPAQNQIVQVKTALNHLTVIQLGEPVLSVAAGSEAFKVEWRGNKVFIEPTEAGVSTDLFIWTKSGRENYELEPAGPVSTMDFVIDTHAADPLPAPKSKAKIPVDPVKAALEGMLGGTPVRQENWKTRKRRIQVMVGDLFEANRELFIRYSIDNRTKKPYRPGTPRVALLNGARARAALVGRAYTQLSAAEAGDLTQVQTPLAVTAHAAQAKTVLAGHETVGVVAVKYAGLRPAIVRLEFRDQHGRTVSALVVI